MDESERLVREASQGDSEAFRQLVSIHHEKVFGFLFQIVKNEEDAKDLLQQTWIKVWNKLHTFKGKSAFGTWLYRIATFTAWDFIRKRKRQSEVLYLDEMLTTDSESIQVTYQASASPDRALQRKEMMEQFELALNSLPVNQRTALVLREIEGLTYQEIADVMNCRKGTVMSRIFNARKAVQNRLKQVP